MKSTSFELLALMNLAILLPLTPETKAPPVDGDESWLCGMCCAQLLVFRLMFPTGKDSRSLFDVMVGKSHPNDWPCFPRLYVVHDYSSATYAGYLFHHASFISVYGPLSLCSNLQFVYMGSAQMEYNDMDGFIFPRTRSHSGVYTAGK